MSFYKNLIVFPLKKELQHVIEWLKINDLSFEKKQNQGKWYVEVPSWNSILTLGGYGKAQYALQTQFWFDYFDDIEVIIGAGAAGSLQNNIAPGDIVLVTEIIEHDFKDNFAPNTPLPLFKTSSAKLKNNNEYPFSIHQGRLASGDEDVMGEEKVNELVERTKAIAVAWESAGGVRAAQFNNIPYKEVRVITDSAKSNAAIEFQKNLKSSLENLAHFLNDVLIPNKQ